MTESNNAAGPRPEDLAKLVARATDKDVEIAYHVDTTGVMWIARIKYAWPGVDQIGDASGYGPSPLAAMARAVAQYEATNLHSGPLIRRR